MPEQKDFADSALRRNFLQAHRRLALLGLGGFCIAFVACLLVVYHAQRLTGDGIPAILAANECQVAITRSDAALWQQISMNDQESARLRLEIWEKEITPRLHRLTTLSRYGNTRQPDLEHAAYRLRAAQEEFAAQHPQPADARSAMNEALASLLGLLREIAAEEHRALDVDVRRSTETAAVSAGIIALLMLFAAYNSRRIALQQARRVVTPVELLLDGAKKLAAGRLREDLPVLSEDELGELTKAFNALRVSLALAEMRHRTLFAHTSNSMALLDPHSFRIVDANHAFETLTGHKRRDVIGRTVFSLFSEQEATRIEKDLRTLWRRRSGSVECVRYRPPVDGAKDMVLEMRFTLYEVSSESVLELSLFDITEQHERQEELSLRAMTDELTGLFNHRSFYEKLRAEIGGSRREDREIVLFFLDLDNFKHCNDTYGHQVGDELLRNVGRIIQNHIRQNRDHGFRYGGDEFAIILIGASLQVGRRIAHQVRRDYEGVERYGTSISIGVAKCLDGMDAETLVRAADEALYQAKSLGKNAVVVAGEPGIAK